MHGSYIIGIYYARIKWQFTAYVKCYAVNHSQEVIWVWTCIYPLR